MSVVLTALLLTVGAHLNGTTPDAAPPPQQTTEPKPVVVIAPKVLPTVKVDRTVAPPVITVRPSRLKVNPTQGVPSLTMRATLSGVVKAPGGGVIPGAVLTLTSSTMTGSRVVNTDGRGQFSVNDLAPGAYDVTVTRPGFRTWKAQVQLTANQHADMNISLEVGRLEEMVTIRGSRPMPTGPLPDVSQLRTASDFYDAAKAYYERAQFVEAERLTNRALELVRSEAAGTASAATIPPDNSRVLRVGGNVKEPKIIRRVEPIYPQIALTAKVQGYVIIEAIITTDGTVRDAKVIKPAPLLDDAALGAVRQWQYSPTIVDGEPVEIVMSVTVIFSLPKDGGGR